MPGVVVRKHILRFGLLAAFAILLALTLRQPGDGLRKAPLPEAAKDDAAVMAGFDLLAGFELTLPEVIENEQGLLVHADTPVIDGVPEGVRQLDGRTVTVSGFMQPVSLRRGTVDEFLLLRDRDTCCFGGTPKVNHWIGVQVANSPVEARLGRPITVTGRLSVREIRSEGVVVGLYTLEALRVEKGPE